MVKSIAEGHSTLSNFEKKITYEVISFRNKELNENISANRFEFTRCHVQMNNMALLSIFISCYQIAELLIRLLIFLMVFYWVLIS